MDRRVIPSRIVDVLREVDADIIALQEVIGAGPTGSGQAEAIGAGWAWAGSWRRCATCATTCSATWC